MMFGSKMHQYFDENASGRDFIVGDLHGSVLLLKKFMKMIGFDESKDRIFAVGDLVDRGTHSFETLKLIEEPWFHSVLGNHEQMLYSFVAPFGEYDSLYRDSFFGNGGNWISDYDVRANYDELTRLTGMLANLPRVITIKGHKKVHIVHAEFHTEPEEVLVDSMIEDPNTLERLLKYPSSDHVWNCDGDTSFWGRRIFNNFYNTDPTEEFTDVDLRKYNSDDLSLIVCGHTIARVPIRAGKILNIDTGAWFFSRPLSIYCIQMDQIIQVDRDSDDIKFVDPYVIPIDDN